MQLQRTKEAEVKKLEGNEFYKKKDFNKALELYSAAIELNPSELLYYTNMAAVFIEQKKYDEAIA
jgi:tetratricopeptide (TPR) repeat protein